MSAPETAERCVVVVPTYDEAENIVRLLDTLAVEVPYADVLVVDDNSPDGTADRVRSHPTYGGSVHLLERPGKAGLGAAYRAGFAWAIEHGYDRIAQMDADFSHPPARLDALFGALDDAQDPADVAVGSRYVPGGGVENWDWRRRLLSWGGNLYVRLLLRTGVHDNTAGFKAFRREALETIGALASESNGYGFQIENTWRAAQADLRVTEVPITFTDRVVGTSKMSGAIAREALLKVLFWRFGEVLTFLTVGGIGYLVDVASFNFFRSLAPFDAYDPAVARTLAVVVAMVVTYVGNRTFTWKGSSDVDRRREMGLFVIFNVIGFGFSVVTLLISHDLLGMTSRLADNISANVLGMALGTAFRFWSYKRFVFATPNERDVARRPVVERDSVV